jgi:ketosteroid isomerase-like protein
VRRTLLLAATLAWVSCRFERRPDLDADGNPSAESVTLPSALATPLGDSIRAVVAALGEALEAGDVSRVAELTVPGATLIDQEEGLRWSREDAAAPLPRALLSSRDEPLTWALSSSDLTPFADAALLVHEYQAAVTGENVPWRAVETYLAVRTPEGWRVRHLHRSRGQAPPPPSL